MNKRKYFKQLNQMLSGIDKARREDILKEIESHIAEANIQDDQLEAHFGTPLNLAKEYIGEDEIKQGLAKSMKKGIGIVMKVIIAVIAIVVFAAWYLSKDDFNYANMDALEKHTENEFWETIDMDGDMTLDIRQSQVVIYDSENEQLKFLCKGDRVNDSKEKIFSIYQNKCFVKIPRFITSIELEQARLVSVNIDHGLSFDINQSALEFVEPDTGYQYNVDIDQAEAEVVGNESSNVIMNVQAYQSTVRYYKY